LGKAKFYLKCCVRCVTWKWIDLDLHRPLNKIGFNKNVLSPGTRSVGLSPVAPHTLAHALENAFKRKTEIMSNIRSYVLFKSTKFWGIDKKLCFYIYLCIIFFTISNCAIIKHIKRRTICCAPNSIAIACGHKAHYNVGNDDDGKIAILLK